MPGEYNSTIAFGIDGGNIVGKYQDVNSNTHGFIYDGTTYAGSATAFFPVLDLGAWCSVFPFGADAVEQGGRRFVGAGVPGIGAGQFGFGWHQFTAERLGQDRLRQAVGPLRGRRDAGFDGVGQLEQGIDATDDFVLFSKGWD